MKCAGVKPSDGFRRAKVTTSVFKVFIASSVSNRPINRSRRFMPIAHGTQCPLYRLAA